MMRNTWSQWIAKILVLGLGLGALSSSAFAQNSSACSWIQSDIASGYCTGSCVENYQAMHPECFGSATNGAVAVQQIASTSLQQVLSISSAVGSRFAISSPTTTADAGQRVGMAAGNAASRWNVWVNANESRNKYDRGNFTIAAIDGANIHRTRADTDVTNIVLGADYVLSPAIVLGLSAAFDRSNGTAESFRNGASNGVVNSTVKGHSIAPYLAWNINRDWSLDATVGFGSGEVSSGTMKGDTDRVFYGLNLNYAKWYGNWQVTGKGGYFYGEEKHENLKSSGTVMNATGSKNKLDQLRLGAQAGYWMDGVMPYVGLSYSADQKHSTSATANVQTATEIGKDAWLWSIGVNFFSLKSGITGGISYNQESGRDHAKQDAILANISIRF